MIHRLRSTIFEPSVPFREKALEIFRYQSEECDVYSRFAETFGYGSGNLPAFDRIPLLPVRAFREVRLSTHSAKAKLIFRSSGTSAMVRSVHEVTDQDLYAESVTRGFDHFYPDNPVIWSWLPGYRDNPDSSLIWMLKRLISRDESGCSTFLPDHGHPSELMREKLSSTGRGLILFGAAFGLLDLVESGSLRLPHGSTIIETGGMKTHRREMNREQLHRMLAEGFGLNRERIHSEYGMCELLSQAYAVEAGWFEPVPWMQVTIRDPENPVKILPPGEEGLIGVIDLANLYSCSFILTEDRGVSDRNGRFQVMGRWNPASLRGCNFLIDRE